MQQKMPRKREAIVTGRLEDDRREQVGRILSIVGDLLHEAGELVNGEPAEAAAAVSSPGAAAENDRAGAKAEAADHAAGQSDDREGEAGPDRPGAELLLVCDSPQGEVAFPWSWVAATEPTAEGAQLLCRIMDPRGEQTLRLGRVRGLMTWDELVARGASVQRFFNPDELTARLTQGLAETGAQPATPLPAAERQPWAPGPAISDAVSDAITAALDEALPSTPPAPAVASRPQTLPPAASPAPPAPGAAMAASEPIPFPEPFRRGAIEPLTAVSDAPNGRMKPPVTIPEQVCIISPSALARRFLMRHLCDLGYEVLEARDLDDPLLPADLRGVTALFLDESLQDDWASRPAAARGEIPIVLLTVDGELSVPRGGESPDRQAVLPRPFERAEVERVVRWLRALRTGGVNGGGTDNGNAEDDTWLFADPFGTARAGEHSRS
jgi:hypothetical protein